MDRENHAYMYAYIGVGGCMDGWMDGWTDGWMDGSTSVLVHPQLHFTYLQVTMGRAVLHISIFHWKEL